MYRADWNGTVRNCLLLFPYCAIETFFPEVKFFIVLLLSKNIFVYLQEVAVKKFLDQDFYGDALDEFRSEVGETIYILYILELYWL